MLANQSRPTSRALVTSETMVAATGKRGLTASGLAWTLGLSTVALLAFGFFYWLRNGIFSPIHIVYLAAMVNAIAGALVASQHPRNVLGWMMLAFTLCTGISEVPFEYGFSALNSHSSLPFASIALWVASWDWVPPFGLGLAMIVVRFPDGRVPHGWRFVDWLAIAGTVFFAVAVAFTPGPLYPLNNIANPFGLSWAHGQLALLFGLGATLIGAAGLTSVASLAARYRRADRELRQQLKWILLSVVVVIIALVYGVVVEIAFHTGFSTAHTPFSVAMILVPIAIGVAMLRHRLFDIDLIINRTLVYALLTAILGGLYVAGIELTQRLFVLYTGQKSDTAIVVTAFVVATAFTPVQKWVERVVELRLGGRDPVAKLDALTSSVEAVIRVIDPHQVARRLVEESVAAFEAVGGALYLDSYDRSQPFHASGHLGAGCTVEVAVRHAEQSLGRLLLGRRRGNALYSDHDQAAIQRSADALGEALGVAHEFGHVSHRKPV